MGLTFVNKGGSNVVVMERSKRGGKLVHPTYLAPFLQGTGRAVINYRNFYRTEDAFPGSQ